jgi:hypothetical protein
MSASNSTSTKWINIIEQWKLSGKSALVWCRENQVAYPSFIGWRKRLGLNTSVKITPPSSVNNQFLELQDYPKKQAEISLEVQGIFIHLKGDFDSSLLKKCLIVLRGLPC